jgi:transposase-like protein
MEVACPYVTKNDIHHRLLSIDPDRSCAFPAYMDEPQRYFCHGCERQFDDLGSLAAHMEMSRARPARVDSVYSKEIIRVVNGGLE